MEQTIGSQFLGSWYDVIGYIVASAIFFSMAARPDNESVRIRKCLPPLFSDKRFCSILGIVTAVIAIYNFTTNDIKTGVGDISANSLKDERLRPWQQIDSNRQGALLYIDPQSIKKTDEGVEYWAKVEYIPPRVVSASDSVLVSFDKFVVNCARGTYSHRIGGVTTITTDGKFVSPTFAHVDEQVFIKIPDSLTDPNARTYRYLCKLL